MSKERGGAQGERKSIDVTTVRPGQIDQMARAGAVPSMKFQAAIDRAVARQR